jgi:hypothetical protein
MPIEQVLRAGVTRSDRDVLVMPRAIFAVALLSLFALTGGRASGQTPTPGACDSYFSGDFSVVASSGGPYFAGQVITVYVPSFAYRACPDAKVTETIYEGPPGDTSSPVFTATAAALQPPSFAATITLARSTSFWASMTLTPPGSPPVVKNSSNVLVITVQAPTPTPEPPSAPVILTEEGTGRGVAVDSVTLTRDPLQVVTANNFSPDRRDRVTFFAGNVDLMPGEPASVVTAQAEDAGQRVYPLSVEYVGKVPDMGWLTQIVVKLPDALSHAGDVSLSINLRGVSSKKVTIRIN